MSSYFKMLQTYLNEGFLEQLDVHNYHMWVTSEIKQNNILML